MRYAIAFALALTVSLAGCGGSFEPTTQPDLAQRYRDEFGSPPPQTVRDLHAKVFMQGDAVMAWLRFDATPEVVDALVASRFEHSSREHFAENTGGANVPVWWTPGQHQFTAYYEAAGWRREFSHSIAYLAYDADKRVVYFCHDAVQ